MRSKYPQYLANFFLVAFLIWVMLQDDRYLT